MCLDFTNSYLFTASKDGSLGIWKVSDPRIKRDKDQVQISYSKEILTERTVLRDLQSSIGNLNRQNVEIKLQNEAHCKARLAERDEMIANEKKKLEDQKRNNEKKRGELNNEILEMDKKYQDDIQKKNRENTQKLDQQKESFKKKQDDDKQRLEEL